MIRKKTAMTLIIVGPALNLQQMPKVLIVPLDAEACASKQTDACTTCLGKLDSAGIFSEVSLSTPRLKIYGLSEDKYHHHLIRYIECQLS